MGALTMPATASLSTLALGAGALALGWKIGRTLDTRWLHFSGDYGTNNPTQDNYSGANYVSNRVIRWQWASPSVPLPGPINVGVAGWYGYYSECSTLNCVPSTSSGYWSFSSDDASVAYPNGACAMTTAIFAGINRNIANSLGSGMVGKYAYIHFATASTTCALYMTDANMRAKMAIDTDKVWVAETADKTATGFAVPADPGTGSATATQLRADLLSGTDAEDAEIAKLIVPDSGVQAVGTIVLPPPDANETVVEYRQRLREMGWLGTATTAATISDASSPLWGPLAPRLIKIRVGTGLEDVFPVPGWEPVGYAGPANPTWPDTPPTIQPQDSIEFTPNDSGADAVDTATATPPSGIPAGGSGGCDAWVSADLDLSPLTGLQLGDKFPFGVFVWAEDWLDAFTTTAVAPSWSFSTPSLAGQTVPTFDIDLDWLDGYMDTFRTIISWCLWVGAVWFLASSMLGLRLGGDPADAVDDVL